MAFFRFSLFSFVVVLFLVPASVFAESIDHFQSQIYLRDDGSLDVTEWITYDFESASRHGIFRTIPLSHPSGDPDLFHERYIDIEITSVQMDARGAPYEVSEGGEEIEVKIGDPDVTISGTHLYEINYHVHGALQYLGDGSVDLNWNVTGNGWEVPIESVTARVPDPGGLYLDAAACYEGAIGATVPCEIATSTAFVDFYAEHLAPGEGLTIARAVDPEKVARQELIRLNGFLVGLIIAGLWLLGFAAFVYREEVRHRTGRAIIPQYEPYGDLPPMYSGLLLDGRIDARDITACIVHLAERKYLKIKKIDRKVMFLFEVDDYEITLLRPVQNATGRFQTEILGLLFGSFANAGARVTLSDLKKNSAKLRENHAALQKLKKAAVKDLVSEGFFENRFRTLSYVGIGVLVISGIVFWVGLASIMPLLFWVVPLSFLIMLPLYRRRTRKGYEALDHLKGFKLFLSVTEKERYEFHNAPEKSPEQFMEYLPYAIAFGVEKKWAEVFKDITIPNPDWYDGGSAASFSAVNLTSSIGAFSTAFASSSGSSSTSASGGGGFSGGGGGGGGGGSW